MPPRQTAEDILTRADDDEEAYVDDDEGEEVDVDEDAAMEDFEDEEDPQEEVQLQNDSIAHFDGHKDSIFCIAQHPVHRKIIATGGGDDLTYVFDISSAGQQSSSVDDGRPSLAPVQKLDGHTDSVNAILFTQPSGEYLISAGLDGQIRAYRDALGTGKQYKFIGEAKEVEEVNFLTATSHADYPNTFALGANDGSVWVYTVDASDKNSPLNIVQSFFLHTMSATAGTWTPDGKLLCTVSEDGSFYIWDVFGDAAAAGVAPSSGSQSVVALTGDDERFRVDGGLYSVAVAPNGAFAAVGGAEGHVRIVGLPRLSSGDDHSATASVKGGAGAKAKPGGSRQAAGPKGTEASAGQAGAILASIQTQRDSIESIAFAQAPLTLMATASVDGSLTLFDTARRFAVRRHIKEAHEGEAVIKAEFLQSDGDEKWIVTSAGLDGVIRRWDTRGANVPVPPVVGGAGPTSAMGTQGQSGQAQGMIGEWKGHRGGGEGGGIMGFVQENPKIVVTAGDDGVALVFDMIKH